MPSSIRRAYWGHSESIRWWFAAEARASAPMAMVEHMTSDSLRGSCLALPQATETYPFGEETFVFKTSRNAKIFAISALGSDSLDVSLKCDREESIALRSEFAGITPGYHLNKKHWITIRLDGSVADDLVEQLVGGVVLFPVFTVVALTLAVGDCLYERIWRVTVKSLGSDPPEAGVPWWRSALS